MQGLPRFTGLAPFHAEADRVRGRRSCEALIDSRPLQAAGQEGRDGSWFSVEPQVPANIRPLTATAHA
jgi:hypothetical protein